MKADHITAEELRDISVEDEDDFMWVLHRGELDHSEEVECVCCPLVLSRQQIKAHSTYTLQEILDQHYRVH